MKYIFESLEDNFKFGKFKGRSLREVYTGSGAIDSKLFFEFLKSPTVYKEIDSVLPDPYSLFYEIKEINSQRIIFHKSNLDYLKLNGLKERDFISTIRAEVMFSSLDYIPVNNSNFRIVDYVLKAVSNSRGLPSGSPDAIKWYLNNISDFCIKPDVLTSLFSLYSFDFIGVKLSRLHGLEFSFQPYFKKELITTSIEFLEKNRLKYENRNHNSIKSNFDDRTYTRYEGHYASDEMGLSDQDIDDVFDGNPEAYWNID